MSNWVQQNLFQTNTNEAIMNLENVASFLGVSSATIRNWVKCGVIKSFSENSKNTFHVDEVKKIKSNITNGEIGKLNQRANKSKANRTFTPDEYLGNKNELDNLNEIILFVQEKRAETNTALFLIALNLLAKEGLLAQPNIAEVNDKKLKFKNVQAKKEIQNWSASLKQEIKDEYKYLLNCHLPQQRDILGFIYQSLLLEGKKSQNGSYYTPSEIVDDIVKNYANNNNLKILDPCCGTGQFLLAFAENITEPNNIFGMDIDEMAVKIARLNLIIKFKDKVFEPKIHCKNTLLDNELKNNKFDIIATNPPWGIHFSKNEVEELKTSYPNITSFESFSYFIQKGMNLLEVGGILSFVLPESILNVSVHKDIRSSVLENTQIKKVVYLDRVFKNVFTPVIRLDLKKEKSNNNTIVIQKEDRIYETDQTRWSNNKNFVFDIHTDGTDASIIDKIFNTEHITLENQAEWALGIVTGNNEKHLVKENNDDTEEIYKGKDVERFVLGKAENFIKFTPKQFQQIAPEEKYRAKEKLIYRFISKYLIFAYDDKQKLTLNSANIVIPKIPNYPIKVICALFNSSLYQLIFQKKFSSIKVLRNHIEQLPLPKWDERTFNTIIEFVDKIIAGENVGEKLDRFISDKFLLNNDEYNYIKTFNK